MKYRNDRLVVISSLVPDNSNVADIGADHGVLETILLTTKENIHVLAIENKEGPYKNLFNNLHAVKNIRLSYSDGLTAVDDTIDTLVLAGMGGMNIIDILSKYPKKLKRIKTVICDAHKDIDKLRHYMVDNGFKILKEVLVLDQGIYYIINKFVRAKRTPAYKPTTYEIGKKLYNQSLWVGYQKLLLDECDSIIKKLKDTPNSELREKEILAKKERILNYGKD